MRGSGRLAMIGLAAAALAGCEPRTAVSHDRQLTLSGEPAAVNRFVAERLRDDGKLPPLTAVAASPGTVRLQVPAAYPSAALAVLTKAAAEQQLSYTLTDRKSVRTSPGVTGNAQAKRERPTS